jgi:hypothetical protein
MWVAEKLDWKGLMQHGMAGERYGMRELAH